MGWTSCRGAGGERGEGAGSSQGPGDGKEEADLRSRTGAARLTQERLRKAVLCEFQPAGQAQSLRISREDAAWYGL